MRLTFDSHGRSIPIDAFTPAGAGSHPLILVLHGSGGMWNPVYLQYAEQFARFGFAVFAPHYFSRTDTDWADDARIHQHFAAWLETATHALDFAAAQPGVDPGRAGVLGFSLGGFLALSLAARDARVKAVVEFFGGLPEELARECRRMPPTLILHGDADERVPVRWAHELEAKLKECGAPYEKHIYRGAGHVFNLPTMLDAGRRTVEFFRKYLGSSAGNRR